MTSIQIELLLGLYFMVTGGSGLIGATPLPKSALFLFVCGIVLFVLALLKVSLA